MEAFNVILWFLFPYLYCKDVFLIFMKFPEYPKYMQDGIVIILRKYRARCLIRNVLKSLIQKLYQPLDGKGNTIHYLLIEDISNKKNKSLLLKKKVKSRLVFYACSYVCVSSKLSLKVNVNSLSVKGSSVIKIKSFPRKK